MVFSRRGRPRRPNHAFLHSCDKKPALERGASCGGILNGALQNGKKLLPDGNLLCIIGKEDLNEA